MERKYIIILLLFAITLGSCKKDPEYGSVDFKVQDESVLPKALSVSISGQYQYLGMMKSAVLELSEDEAMTDVHEFSMSLEGTAFRVEADGLEHLTSYYYRYVFTDRFQSITTQIKSFSTLDFAFPEVATIDLQQTSQDVLMCRGEVTNDGNTPVIDRGICWALHENPTLTDSAVSKGPGLGSFTVEVTGLSVGKWYYVRAYATNAKGTAYGEVLSFRMSWNNGIIPGWFTVDNHQNRVQFSQGNLQYQASTNTWRFAESQTTVIGDGNTSISSTNSNWIDMFGWGTSGYNHGAVCYQPWSTSQNNSDYEVYGNSMASINDGDGKADWGYNAISNGGNVENMWSTLTSDEWDYLLFDRSTLLGNRFVKARVDGVNGLIVFPDDWNTDYSLNNVNSNSAAYGSNSIYGSTWVNTFEVNGAVFLPAAGRRLETSMAYVDTEGIYWTSAIQNSVNAYCLGFGTSTVNLRSSARYYGRSVRLVLR